MRIRTAIVTLGALAAMSLDASGQSDLNRFQVVVQGGWHTYAGGSAIEGGASVGSDASYFISETVGIGVWTDYTFTEADGSKFPPVALSFVDSTTFTTLNQPLDIWQYGGHVKLRLPGSISPFVLVGAGGYTVFLDPQQANGPENTSGFVARFGVGVDLAISDVAGFELGISDAFYPNWEPQRVFPVRSQFQNSRFPELNPDPGDLSDSVHNLRFTAGLTLVPGG